MFLKPEKCLGGANICKICMLNGWIKGLRHGISSYFDHRQNYLKTEENLKTILYNSNNNNNNKKKKNTKGTIINHKKKKTKNKKNKDG